jgi:hypothetical protein
MGWPLRILGLPTIAEVSFSLIIIRYNSTCNRGVILSYVDHPGSQAILKVIQLASSILRTAAGQVDIQDSQVAGDVGRAGLRGFWGCQRMVQ